LDFVKNYFIYWEFFLWNFEGENIDGGIRFLDLASHFSVTRKFWNSAIFEIFALTGECLLDDKLHAKIFEFKNLSFLKNPEFIYTWTSK